MKWIPGAGRAEDEQLEADYEKSTVQGKFRLGETYLFRKKALGVWYLAWREILWAYRQGAFSFTTFPAHETGRKIVFRLFL